MYKSLKELLLEREVIEGKIRALRIQEARATVARALSTGMPVEPAAFSALQKVNTMISGVHYIKKEVDDLLDIVEDYIS